MEEEPANSDFFFDISPRSPTDNKGKKKNKKNKKGIDFIDYAKNNGIEINLQYEDTRSSGQSEKNEKRENNPRNILKRHKSENPSNNNINKHHYSSNLNNEKIKNNNINNHKGDNNKDEEKKQTYFFNINEDFGFKDSNSNENDSDEENIEEDDFQTNPENNIHNEFLKMNDGKFDRNNPNIYLNPNQNLQINFCHNQPNSNSFQFCNSTQNNPIAEQINNPAYNNMNLIQQQNFYNNNNSNQQLNMLLNKSYQQSQFQNYLVNQQNKNMVPQFMNQQQFVNFQSQPQLQMNVNLLKQNKFDKSGITPNQFMMRSPMMSQQAIAGQAQLNFYNNQNLNNSMDNSMHMNIEQYNNQMSSYSVSEENVIKIIDFYFSQPYLNMDSYIREAMDEDGWVPIEIILTFKKINAMQITREIIINSLNELGSDIVEYKMNDNRTLLRNKDFEKFKNELKSIAQIKSEKEMRRNQLIQQKMVEEENKKRQMYQMLMQQRQMQNSMNNNNSMMNNMGMSLQNNMGINQYQAQMQANALMSNQMQMNQLMIQQRQQQQMMQQNLLNLQMQKQYQQSMFWNNVK